MTGLFGRAVLGCIVAGTVAAGAQAQDRSLTVRPPFAQQDDADDSGALLFHGNYCGPGNRGWGVPPVDALDAACARHDACTPDEGLPTCGCHRRLQFEASAISHSPRQPDDLRALAGLVAVGATLLPCRYGT